MESSLKKLKNAIDTNDTADENVVTELSSFDNLPNELFLEILNQMRPKDLYRFCGSNFANFSRCQALKTDAAPKQMKLVFNVHSSDSEGTDNPHGSILMEITYSPLELTYLIKTVYQVYSDVLELFEGSSDYAHILTVDNYSIELFDMKRLLEQILSVIENYNQWLDIIFFDVDLAFDTIQTMARFSNVKWHDLQLEGSEKHVHRLNLARGEEWDPENLVFMQFSHADIPQQLEEIAREFMEQVFRDVE